MSLTPAIAKVVVAGGGIAGWSVAAALRRHIPTLEVEVVASIPPADSLVDRVISTLPSIVAFHEDLGLTEADTVVRANSGLRIGSVFDGWAKDLPTYVHAYGSYGKPIDGTAFYQQWLRSQRESAVEPFDRYSPAAQLGRAERIAPPSAASSEMGCEIGYGLQLTIERYQQLMRAYALHLGARERPAEIAEVQLRPEDGFVDKLVLSDGGSVTADLYIDCTGAAAKIRSRLGGDFIEWSRWLLCDRLLIVTGAPREELQLLDRVRARASGWIWGASSPATSSHGAAFSSAHAKAEDYLDDLPPECRSTVSEVGLRQGRWAEPWLRNCVPVGDSAVVVEPLEWANLHLIHDQIDRLISMMPGRDCAPVELGEYNRQSCAEADRVRDFICMHYVAARRDEPFWRDAAAIDPPGSLAHTLRLFAERGRLPYYEEETFSKDSWLAVLLGQGFEPQRVDPLADAVPRDEAVNAIAKYGEAVNSFVGAQPSYHQSMSKIGQQK